MTDGEFMNVNWCEDYDSEYELYVKGERKANLNRQVFNCFLKTSKEAANHKPKGRESRGVGVTTSKAQSPFIFRQEQETSSRPRSADLNELLGVYGWRGSYKCLRCLIMQSSVGK